MAVPNNLIQKIITQVCDDIELMLIDFESEINNYQQLKHQVVGAQLKNLHRNLHLLSQQDKTQIKAGLIEIFANHWQQSKNTALSYQAMPEGACNKLMWYLAGEIFEAQMLSEFFALLMPDVRDHLIITAEQVDKMAHTQNESSVEMNVLNAAAEDEHASKKQPLTIRVTKKPLAKLFAGDLSIKMSVLRRLLVVEDIVFDVAQIGEFNLASHADLYLALDNYPQLKTLLYQHNDDLSAIARQVNQIKSGGPLPGQSSQPLIRSDIGFDKTQQLPMALANPLFKQITLLETGDYLQFLKTIPSREHHLLFSKCTIKLSPEQLALTINADRDIEMLC